MLVGDGNAGKKKRETKKIKRIERKETKNILEFQPKHQVSLRQIYIV